MAYSVKDGMAVWRPRHKIKGDLVLRYRVLGYPRHRSAEATFLTREQGVVVGYSAYLVPAELTDYLPSTMTVRVTAPKDWPVWASWPEQEGLYRPPTVHDLWSSVVATGAFREVSMASERASVTVLTESAWAPRTALTVANRLLPVLGGMVSLFDGPPRGDDFHVLAIYRSTPVRGRSIMMGVKEEGAFLCLATPDRYGNLDGITALAVHECLHFYLGGVLTAPPEPPYQNSPDMIWFFEGMTEYLTYRIMREERVIDDRTLARVRREKQSLITDRDLTGVSLAEAARSLDRPSVYELVYAKGYLVAELLDRSMSLRCGDGALDDVLRGLVRDFDFHRTSHMLEQEEILEALERRCPGSADMVRRYAVGNAPLPEDPDAGSSE